MHHTRYTESNLLPKFPKCFAHINAIQEEIVNALEVMGKHNRTLGEAWTNAKTFQEKKEAIAEVMNNLPKQASVKKNVKTGHPGVKPWVSLQAQYKPYGNKRKGGKSAGGQVSKNFRNICLSRRDPTVMEYAKKPTIEYPISIKEELKNFMGLTKPVTSRANIMRFLNNYFSTMNLRVKSNTGEGGAVSPTAQIELNDALKTLFRAQNGKSFQSTNKAKKNADPWVFKINDHGKTIIPSVYFNNLVKVFILPSSKSQSSANNADVQAESLKYRSISTNLKKLKELEKSIDDIKKARHDSEEELNGAGLDAELLRIQDEIATQSDFIRELCNKYKFPYKASPNKGRRASSSPSASPRSPHSGSRKR